MAVINPKSIANLAISPEQRKENHKKASITRREKKEKEYQRLHEREVALQLTKSSSRAVATVLGVNPRQIQHMRRYIKDQAQG